MREIYGYPLWVPLVFIAIILVMLSSAIAAVFTGEWRWLLIAAICFLLISRCNQEK